jgi:hypothetical protein
VKTPGILAIGTVIQVEIAPMSQPLRFIVPSYGPGKHLDEGSYYYCACLPAKAVIKAIDRTTFDYSSGKALGPNED